MTKRILIMGNGPSLKEVDFKRLKIDSFGMNNAYKFYKDLGWYPTYWGCFDDKMTKYNHKGHKDFFLSGDCEEYFTLNKELKDIPKVTYVDSSVWRKMTLEHYTKEKPFRNVGHTAANCVQIAINKSYEEIYLIGFDGHYNGKSPKEFTKGIIKDSKRQYAWDGYQGESENFNPLRIATININLKTWKHLSEWSNQNKIKVFNCNDKSQILKGLFEFIDLKKANLYKEE